MGTLPNTDEALNLAYSKELAAKGVSRRSFIKFCTAITAAMGLPASMVAKVAETVAKSSAISIIGGGDSVKAINRSGFSNDVTFMSTGGGASLEFLEGKDLPGVSILDTD